VPPSPATEATDAGAEPAPERTTRRDTEADGGINPELPPPRASDRLPPARDGGRPQDGQGGYAPDQPPPRPQDSIGPKTTGIAPDLPPERPTQNKPTRGIRVE
jgi:hypothetical protein